MKFSHKIFNRVKLNFIPMNSLFKILYQIGNSTYSLSYCKLYNYNQH